MASIIIVGPAYPFRGGIAAFNESLARTWQAMGHQVQIITFTVQYPSFLFPGKSQYSEDAAPTDLRITRALSSVNPVSWLQVGQKIKRLKPDLVLFRYWLPFMGPSLGTVARIIKGNKHTKVVALTDNVVPHEARLGDKQFTQYFLTACDAFVTMSDAVTADLKKFNVNKPIASHPHPIYDIYGAAVAKQVAREQLGLQQAGRYILFFGFIRKYKGLDLLLEALQDPRLTEMGVNLIIAGEFYEDAAPYKSQIEKNNLTARVILATDFIPNEQVSTYFCAADLVVQPYKHATQSGVTQVAYHFDKPMLVTKVGGLAELVPHGKVGYVVEVQVQAIADAIVEYYQLEKETEMAAHVQAVKKRFAWDSMAETILHVVDAT